MRARPAARSHRRSAPWPTGARVADAHAPLAAVLGELRTEGRENEAAITDRDRAVAEWTIVYQGVATTLSGLYRLAGRADLADRIRPTERRASGQDRAPAEPPADPAVPADPAPTDPVA